MAQRNWNHLFKHISIKWLASGIDDDKEKNDNDDGKAD